MRVKLFFFFKDNISSEKYVAKYVEQTRFRPTCLGEQKLNSKLHLALAKHILCSYRREGNVGSH